MEKFLKWVVHNGKGSADDEVQKDLDREFASKFVRVWKVIFVEKDPSLLLQVEGMMPKSPLVAFASIVLTIQAALLRREGRTPMLSKSGNAVDPLEIHIENERLKKIRKRGSSQTVEDLLQDKFEASRNTVAKALQEGQAAANAIESLKSALPTGSDIQVALVDYESRSAVFTVVTKTR
ncbi:MAG: hypothetical protein KA207_02770 [Burkholderiaceae bacterium]|nr:hypothetical protein [Burkholderiaceae bacterium]